ncbi:MAG: hypothetical protein M3186_11425 [Actinomycetota bacterium]|nr:hypothetical protein [Actinomycetota bacterium]
MSNDQYYRNAAQLAVTAVLADTDRESARADVRAVIERVATERDRDGLVALAVLLAEDLADMFDALGDAQGVTAKEAAETWFAGA